jgi:superfamily II DNA helicase RecQ
LTRTDFENLLRALGKAGLIKLNEQSFEKDDETIRYTKAELTHEGYAYKPADSSGISLSSQVRTSKILMKQTYSSKKQNSKVVKRPVFGMAENPELHTRLKEWRLSAAKKQGLPAFRIFSNRVLDSLSSALPTTHDELLMVEGVGPRFDERYGNDIIKLVKQYLRR